MAFNGLYRILGFDQQRPWPTESWLILGGNTEVVEACSACGADIAPRTEVCLQGYDEYASGDFRLRAFWPNDEELITLKDYANEIAASLSGVIAVPVRYSDWNQNVVPKWRLALKKPRLAALEIVGRVIRAYSDNAGVGESCSLCGGVLASRRDAEDLRPVSSAWDGSDVFLVAGTYHRYITAAGLAKLRSLGFQNLRVQESAWAAA